MHKATAAMAVALWPNVSDSHQSSTRGVHCPTTFPYSGDRNVLGIVRVERLTIYVSMDTLELHFEY